MIKHIVAWKFAEHAEGADRAANVALVADALRALPAIIDEVIDFEVVVAQPGMDCTADLALYSTFADAASLRAYAEHPEHLKVVALMQPRRVSRECVDYDTAAL